MNNTVVHVERVRYDVYQVSLQIIIYWSSLSVDSNILVQL